MKNSAHKNGKLPQKQKIVEPPRRLGDEDISIADLRASLGDLVTRVSYNHDRVVITKHGKPVAAIISASDMEKFEELEDWNDIQAAEASERETERTGGPIPWRTIKREMKLRRPTDAVHR
ncbi:MAG TPA: type II toxin-antitoxin system Phd/YefM family antitoxin [Candidatus Binataceae bacterium]|nr:type II toxin-antitoxin system Phd/YefM family antitoxin [Candidatus Binataceae bacterium]